MYFAAYSYFNISLKINATRLNELELTITTDEALQSSTRLNSNLTST